MKRSLQQMVELSARVPRGVDGYWEIIRALDADGPFTVSDIDARSNVNRADVAQYVRRLVKAGIARVAGERPGKSRTPARLYRLVKRPGRGPHPRRDGSLAGPSGTQRMWTAMRTVKVFDASFVAFSASMPGEPVTRAAVGNYIRRLAAAGYLVGEQAGLWRLKPGMNTGPLAPAIMRVNFLWDRNLRRAVGGHVAEEVA